MVDVAGDELTHRTTQQTTQQTTQKTSSTFVAQY